MADKINKDYKINGVNFFDFEKEQKILLLRKVFREVAEAYSFFYLNVPVIEPNSLYKKILINEEEERNLVSFVDGRKKISLRKDLQVSLFKSYIVNGFSKKINPGRFWTDGAVYKKDPSLKDGIKEGYENIFEIIGSSKYIADAILIQMAVEVLRRLQIKGYEININYLGEKETKQTYKKSLLKYISGKKINLKEKNKKLIKENPFLIFNRKQEKDLYKDELVDILLIEDYYSDEDKKNYIQIKKCFDESNIKVKENSKYFPEDVYSNRFVFQIIKDGQVYFKGARNDLLSELLGYKKDIPMVSMIADFEVIMEDIKKEILEKEEGKKKNQIFLAHLGELAKYKILGIFNQFVASGLNVKEAMMKDTLRSQLNIAIKENLDWFLIVGQKEALDGTIIIKEIRGGTQKVMSLDRFFEKIKTDKKF